MEKIPEQKHYGGKRIVLYGPESTGKSTLSLELARHYHTVHIEEYARDFLQEKWDRTRSICSYDDLLPIAVQQRLLENKAVDMAAEYLICDTDILETAVYSHIYFQKVPEAIEAALKSSYYDLYLLMGVDLPWQQDDLRDRPHDRNNIFATFEKALICHGANYRVVRGTGSSRLQNAIQAIDNYDTHL